MLVITRHGGPEVLAVQEVPTPAPKAGEVRVRVRFAGLNFSDVAQAGRDAPRRPPPPCTVGTSARRDRRGGRGVWIHRGWVSG
ncbi:MAG: hypothetical protein U0325_02815 [Polyangiales bacterium]